jgi:hypothetical protein
MATNSILVTTFPKTSHTKTQLGHIHKTLAHSTVLEYILGAEHDGELTNPNFGREHGQIAKTLIFRVCKP